MTFQKRYEIREMRINGGKMKKIIVLAFSLIILISGCSTEKTGNFQLYMTDQPIPDLEHVYITISAIKVQKDDGSIISVWEGEKTFDLLELRDIEELILDVELEAGTYTHIIIVIDSAAIVIDGRTFEIDIILNLEVKIPVVFTIMNDGTTEVVLDFEADQSISIGINDQYLLIPVISVKRVGY